MLGHPRDGVDDDFPKNYQYNVDEPCPCRRRIRVRSLDESINVPFALTQSALILTNALRSSTSSIELPPTSSTLTMLPLRPLPLADDICDFGTEMPRVGIFIAEEMLMDGKRIVRAAEMSTCDAAENAASAAGSDTEFGRPRSLLTYPWACTRIIRFSWAYCTGVQSHRLLVSPRFVSQHLYACHLSAFSQLASSPSPSFLVLSRMRGLCLRVFSAQRARHSQTEPAAFFLDVFFNAQPLHPAQPDSKEKQRAANALVPSTIAYAGGPMEFSVDMGTEVRRQLTEFTHCR